MQEYFVVQAPTYLEAERKAREKYGDRLHVLFHETVKVPGGFLNLFSREGVKLTGMVSKYNRGYREVTPEPPYPVKQVPNQKDPFPTEKEFPKREIKDFQEEKEKILAMSGAALQQKEALLPKDSGKENNQALKEVMNDVKAIMAKLENQGLASSAEKHPTLNRLDNILILNDFPLNYRKTLLEKAKNEFSPNDLNNYDIIQNRVLEWIGESIKIYENDKFNVRPRIMVLVGPTGVGKTTTIAKLAANFGINEKGRKKRNIAIISIDGYRIGAMEQLEKYIKWMEFPFFPATDYDELKKIIALNSEGTDLILVDTIGKNPRDMVKLGEMKKLLDACGTLAEYHLVTAATTKSSDLAEILQQFESFNYRSVIVTKIDETVRTGNVIGTLSEKGKAISYITNGQDVPEDIRKASVVQFLINLEGFKVNRIRIEEKFPCKGQGLMQQWRA